MRVVSFSLTAVMLAVLGAPPAARAADTTVRLDVGLAAGADAAAVVDRLTRPLVDWDPVTGLDAITVDVAASERDTVLAQLAADAGVRYAEPGSTVHADSPSVSIPQYATNDPFLYDRNGPNYRWLEMSQIPQAWTWTLGSSSVTVAVVDTGVSGNPDLGPNRLAAGWDFVDGDADASDDDDHGTQVANLIAGERNNSVGGAGICPQCRILPVRVLGHRDGRSAEGTSADVAAGIVWAADHGADIINLSLSTSTHSRLLAEAVEHADSRGALVVGSAGQTATSARQFPAGFDRVLAVGSINEYGAPSIGSNRNSATDQWIDVLAPDRTWVLGRDGTRQLAGGTSAATAIVSGTAALALAVRPEATADQVRTAIVGSAQSGISHVPVEPYDARILNAARLVHNFGGLPDGEDPQVTGVGLVDGQMIGGDPDIVRSVGVADDHGIARLELVVGGKVVDSTLAAGWAEDLVLDPPAGFDGDLPITVRAVDYAGRRGEKTVTVRVDSTGPAGTITSPREGEHVGARSKVVFTADGDDVAYAMVSGYPMTRIAGTNQWSAYATPEPLDATTVGFVLQAVDRLGNPTTLRRVVISDDSGPTATSVSPAANTQVRGTFTSTINGVKDGAGVAKAELWAGSTYIGRDTTAPYSLQVPTRTANGNLVLTWNLTDKLGNMSTYRRTVVADNKAPTVAFSKAPANGAKLTKTTTITATASDSNGIARVQLLVNGKQVANDARAPYTFTLDPKKYGKTFTVQLRSYDRAGNIRYTSKRTYHR
ncbi:Serine protease, subtilisin family [Actinoplanes regularis]|uniref:Serine protease, subtilisin family n=2 Tax=Actinoplanes regularis TaxID=52697 RepID=A0A239AZC8_9ACTN|nr:Serine protease, subtilisin family [Actinoplanes regularis]